MNERKANIGELVYFCLHTQFPEYKMTLEIDMLKNIFNLNMGVVISEEDDVGYLNLYSQTDEKTITVHKEFIKVLTNG